VAWFSALWAEKKRKKGEAQQKGKERRGRRKKLAPALLTLISLFEQPRHGGERKGEGGKKKKGCHPEKEKGKKRGLGGCFTSRAYLILILLPIAYL